MAQRERETLEVDVLFVGAGPASLSGALQPLPHQPHAVEEQRRPSEKSDQHRVAFVHVTFAAS